MYPGTPQPDSAGRGTMVDFYPPVSPPGYTGTWNLAKLDTQGLNRVPNWVDLSRNSYPGTRVHGYTGTPYTGTRVYLCDKFGSFNVLIHISSGPQG
eukprot:681367-Rhodomonas_salina.1